MGAGGQDGAVAHMVELLGGLLTTCVMRTVTLVGWLLATISSSALCQTRLRPRDVDSLQFGDLRIPSGRGPFPVVVMIHGGCWVHRLASLQNTAALSDALRDAGVATWNVEYRRYDNPGGGWPGPCPHHLPRARRCKSSR